MAMVMTMVMRHLVPLFIDEVVVRVEMQLREEALADELMRHLPLYILYELEHLVVRLPHEHDLPSVQLEQRAPRRPHVDRARVVEAHHDLGRAVESRDEIRRDLGVVRIRRRAEVAHLNNNHNNHHHNNNNVEKVFL